MGYFWAIFTSTTTFLKKTSAIIHGDAEQGWKWGKRSISMGLFPSPLLSLPFPSVPTSALLETRLQTHVCNILSPLIWWQRNCLYVLQSSQSGGMVSSRPIKCRYAILSHFEHWRWEELVHMTSSIASSTIKLDNNVRASSNLSSRELQSSHYR